MSGSRCEPLHDDEDGGWYPSPHLNGRLGFLSRRITRGLDAAAACGQLRNRYQQDALPTTELKELL